MTTTAPPQPIISPVLEGISWETYEAFVRELEEAGQHLRVTYDGGRMVVMSPTPTHEKWKQLLGRLIETLADERDVPISAYGQTTWKRRKLAKGLEPDQCYYVQNVERLRAAGDAHVDLETLPPPDLAVEIEYTHSPIDREAIYAALGVREIWCYDGQRVQVLRLAGARYVRQPASGVFEGFQPNELHRFVAMYPELMDNEIARAFRTWLREQAT